MGEPDSPASILTWVQDTNREQDRFRHIAKHSDEHRQAHRCDAHPAEEGPMLGVLARAVGATRILEIGCGLGYSALWLAYGSRPDGLVETIERDPLHVAAARNFIEKEGCSSQIRVIEGDALNILPNLKLSYDLIFVDSDVFDYISHLSHTTRLVRPGGLLISSNLFYGHFNPATSEYETGAAYRKELLENPNWETVFLDQGTALSVRL